MVIKIICVGKIKESYFNEAIKEYQKRLTKYCELKIIELEDFGNPNPEINKEKECELILKNINPKEYVITLEIEGQEISSLSLAQKIDNITLSNSTIDFIIGGSYGLSDKVKNISNYKLSFSKLTFPHKLFRIMMLEQIYRSFKILNNESYHK